MIESDSKAFQSPLKCSYLTFRGQHSSRESHTYFNEANSSIEYFNDNDETVLQGETQYKHAE